MLACCMETQGPETGLAARQHLAHISMSTLAGAESGGRSVGRGSSSAPAQVVYTSISDAVTEGEVQ